VYVVKKKYSLGIVLFILFFASMAVLAFKSQEEYLITSLEFAYAAFDDFYVSDCSIFYPENVLIEKINNMRRSKIMVANTKPIRFIPGEEYVFLNCTNIDERNSSRVAYEYESISYGSSNGSESLVNKLTELYA